MSTDIKMETTLKNESSNIDSKTIEPTIVNNFFTSKVRLTDSDGKYYCYHYNECDEKDDEQTKNSRGVIRYSSDGNPNNGIIVCKSFNFTPELFSNNKDEIKSIFQNFNFNDLSFYDAEESTLLRLWYHNSCWYLSSHRKLDAKNSYWGNNISHSELFEQTIKHEVVSGCLNGKINYENDSDIIHRFYDSLPNDKIYTFLLRTTATSRIVCNPPNTPTVYFAGEFDNVNFVLQTTNSTGLKRPNKNNFQNIDEVLNYIDNIDIFKIQGLMVYIKEGSPDFKTFKLTNSEHQKLIEVRSNVSDLDIRYLQLRNDDELKSKLLKLYPDFESNFNNIDKALEEIANNIYKKYLTRFVYKLPDGTRKFVTLPQEQWFICKELHDLFLKDKEKFRISLDLVKSHINALDSHKINYLIKKWREQ